MIGLLSLGWLVAWAPWARADYNEWALRGSDSLNSGRYSDAIKWFEKVVYPGSTYENLLAVKFDLAWTYYLVGDYAKAIPHFRDLSGPRAPGEGVKQQSIFLLAECLTRNASALDEKNPERKKQIDEAIELHTKFQADYPKNVIVPQSLYGRAFAYYLLNQYDKAEPELQAIIGKFGNTPVGNDSRYLLASLYSTQGVNKYKENKKDECKIFMDKARAIFEQLSKGNANLAMANESLFSLADTFFNAGMYPDAIRTYRDVRTKADVIQDLKSRMEPLQKKLGEELARQQDTAVTKSELSKVRSQLAGVMESPDLMIAAYFKIAEAYTNMKQYDLARIVYRHLVNFAPDTQKQQAHFALVAACIKEANAAAAAQEFEEFQAAFGADLPIAENAAVAIGQIYMQNGDPEAAIKFFTKSVAEYPAGKMVEDALYMKFSSEYILKKFEDCKASATSYIGKFSKGKYIPNALYFLALSLNELKASEEALKVIDALVEKYPQKTAFFDSLDEAYFQKGAILMAITNRTADAIKVYEAFPQKFPDSKLKPQAMYQIGLAYNTAGQPEKARDMMLAIGKQFPGSDVAPYGLYQLAISYYDKQDFGAMAQSLGQLLQAYPTNAIAADAWFWLGWIGNKKGAFDEAIGCLRKSLSIAPESTRAPDSWLTIGQAYADKAGKMGAPSLLPEDKRAVYRGTLLESSKAFEDLLVHCPNANPVFEGIAGMAQNMATLLKGKQMTAEEIERTFTESMDRQKDANVKAQICFAFGMFQVKVREKAKALPLFKKAFTINPDVRLSPAMLIDYAEALKEASAMDDAEAIYNKIIAEYAADETALAPALFGLGDLRFRKNDAEGAKEFFEKVLKDFPWFEQGKQGRVKLAQILEKNKQYADAEKLYMEVWKQEKSNDARAGAMLGSARCQIALALAGQGDKAALLKKAEETTEKVAVLFESNLEFSAEALCIQARISEWLGDVSKAKELYYRVTTEMKNSSFAKSAAEGLQKLGGHTPLAK